MFINQLPILIHQSLPSVRLRNAELNQKKLWGERPWFTPGGSTNASFPVLGSSLPIHGEELQWSQHHRPWGCLWGHLSILTSNLVHVMTMNKHEHIRSYIYIHYIYIYIYIYIIYIYIHNIYIYIYTIYKKQHI